MYDCPCKNGGTCKECKVKDCKGESFLFKYFCFLCGSSSTYIFYVHNFSDTPVCFCPPEWTGKYCETKSVVPDNPSYGPWSNWNLSSCDGNPGKTRYRERYCRNSLGILLLIANSPENEQLRAQRPKMLSGSAFRL